MSKYEKLIADYKECQSNIKNILKKNNNKINENNEQEELLRFMSKTTKLFHYFLHEIEHNKTQQKIAHENMIKVFDKMGAIIILQNPKNGGAIYTNQAINKIFQEGIEKEKKRFQLLLIELLDIGRGVSSKRQYYDEVNNNWYSVDAVEIEWDNDENIYFHTLNDITGMKQVEELLMNEANLDRMTGVYNRSGGKHAIYKLRETLREGEHACLCMIDLDGLKKINDNYGHNAGDAAIITFANILKGFVSDTELIARMGGDEFIVILKKPKVEAEQVLSLVQEKIDDYNMKSDQPYYIKFSYGLCEFSNRDRVLGEIINKADKMMYKEKKRKKRK